MFKGDGQLVPFPRSKSPPNQEVGDQQKRSERPQPRCTPHDAIETPQSPLRPLPCHRPDSQNQIGGPGKAFRFQKVVSPARPTARGTSNTLRRALSAWAGHDSLRFSCRLGILSMTPNPVIAEQRGGRHAKTRAARAQYSPEKRLLPTGCRQVAETCRADNHPRGNGTGFSLTERSAMMNMVSRHGASVEAAGDAIERVQGRSSLIGSTP